MTYDVTTISRFKKEEHLLSLTEDKFRDQVVRPVFLRSGFTDGRDLCGPDEAGRDCVFLTHDPLGSKVAYFIQTKKGKLNLSRKPAQNVMEAVAQLRTSLVSPVRLLKDKSSLLPSMVILCTSGTINEAARGYILQELGDPRSRCMDADELIPLIDRHYPEYWAGIDSELFPYLRNLESELASDRDSVALTNLIPGADSAAAISDDGYAPTQLMHFTGKLVRDHGKTTLQPDFRNIEFAALLTLPQRQVLVVGDPGSGKSTALRRLAWVIIRRALIQKRQDLVPVILKCRDLHDQQKSLVELATAETMRLSISGNSAFGASELQAGKVVLLLDALDECPSDDARDSVLVKVRTFSANYPSCRANQAS